MSFIKTFSGKHFYYDRINKDDIVINDIAFFPFKYLSLCRTSFTLLQRRPTCGSLQPTGTAGICF
ncbi:Hypothetical protein yfdR [Escherichia coli ISC7]|uniref:Uncharacterized protein n=1 Tax=Escherichia coli ISC7 TaxID=1432555 RepID=W1F9V4_ECOLX|nr:Hypothetical protein yfdR [Escherichia coli ISC7]